MSDKTLPVPVSNIHIHIYTTITANIQTMTPKLTKFANCQTAYQNLRAKSCAFKWHKYTAGSTLKTRSNRNQTGTHVRSSHSGVRGSGNTDIAEANLPVEQKPATVYWPITGQNLNFFFSGN